jgi:hypothetical protein
MLLLLTAPITAIIRPRSLQKKPLVLQVIGPSMLQDNAICKIGHSLPIGEPIDATDLLSLPDIIKL